MTKRIRERVAKAKRSGLGKMVRHFVWDLYRLTGLEEINKEDTHTHTHTHTTYSLTDAPIHTLSFVSHTPIH